MHTRRACPTKVYFMSSQCEASTLLPGNSIVIMVGPSGQLACLPASPASAYMIYLGPQPPSLYTRHGNHVNNISRMSKNR